MHPGRRITPRTCFHNLSVTKPPYPLLPLHLQHVLRVAHPLVILAATQVAVFPLINLQFILSTPQTHTVLDMGDIPLIPALHRVVLRSALLFANQVSKINNLLLSVCFPLSSVYKVFLLASRMRASTLFSTIAGKSQNLSDVRSEASAVDLCFHIIWGIYSCAMTSRKTYVDEILRFRVNF